MKFLRHCCGHIAQEAEKGCYKICCILIPVATKETAWFNCADVTAFFVSFVLLYFVSLVWDKAAWAWSWLLSIPWMCLNRSNLFENLHPMYVIVLQTTKHQHFIFYILTSRVTDRHGNNYQQLYIYSRPSIIMYLFYTISSDVLPEDGPTGAETCSSGLFLNMLLWACDN
jgi:hypothetical protein